MDPSYNNSFGSQAPIVSGPISSGTISSGSAGSPAGSVPLSSGTGDIILGSGKQTKSKKPILIAAIGIVVVLIATLVILVLANMNKDNVAAAIEYANTLIYGDGSNVTVDEMSYRDVRDTSYKNLYYFAENTRTDNEERVEYLRKLYSLINSISGSDDATKMYIRTAKEDLSIYILISAILNNDLLIESYQQNKTLEGVLSDYSYPFNFPEAYSWRYDAELAISSYIAMKEEKFDIMDASGCFNQNANGCSSSKYLAWKSQNEENERIGSQRLGEYREISLDNAAIDAIAIVKKMKGIEYGV